MEQQRDEWRLTDIEGCKKKATEWWGGERKYENIKEGKKGWNLQQQEKGRKAEGMMRRRACGAEGRGGQEILRHVTALFFDFITVLANLISERRHNITIYEWERKGIHGNGHIYYELRPRAFRTQPAPWALSTCHYVKYIRYVENFELFPLQIYCLLFVEWWLLSCGFTNGREIKSYANLEL